MLAHPLFVGDVCNNCGPAKRAAKTGIAIRRHGIKRNVAMPWAVRLYEMETFGDRVKYAASALGGLNSLAKAIGMPRRTLGDQISGKFEVKLSFVIDVAQATGYSMNWIATGEGTMFSDPSKAPPITISPQVLEKLDRLARDVYREAGQQPPPGKTAREAGILYNDLLARVSDINDAEEVEATLPQLRYALKKRLEQAAAEPGTGKRSA